MTKGLIWSIILSGAIIVATLACSGSPASTVTPSTAETSAGGALVATSFKSPLTVAEHPELGTILVDAEGFSLYMAANDTRDITTCTGGCSKTWPPIQASDTLQDFAGEGVNADLLGSFTRSDDGTEQVTYNGHPLYNYLEDKKPGDALGVKIGFGGLWFVLSPRGKAIIPP